MKFRVTVNAQPSANGITPYLDIEADVFQTSNDFKTIHFYDLIEETQQRVFKAYVNNVQSLVVIS